MLLEYQVLRHIVEYQYNIFFLKNKHKDMHQIFSHICVEMDMNSCSYFFFDRILLVVKTKLTKGYAQHIHINFLWLKFCLQSHKFEYTNNLWRSWILVLHKPLHNATQVACPNHTSHTPKPHKTQPRHHPCHWWTPTMTCKFTMAQRLKFFNELSKERKNKKMILNLPM